MLAAAELGEQIVDDYVDVYDYVDVDVHDYVYVHVHDLLTRINVKSCLPHLHSCRTTLKPLHYEDY